MIYATKDMHVEQWGFKTLNSIPIFAVVLPFTLTYVIKVLTLFFSILSRVIQVMLARQ